MSRDYIAGRLPGTKAGWNDDEIIVRLNVWVLDHGLDAWHNTIPFDPYISLHAPYLQMGKLRCLKSCKSINICIAFHFLQGPFTFITIFDKYNVCTVRESILLSSLFYRCDLDDQDVKVTFQVSKPVSRRAKRRGRPYALESHLFKSQLHNLPAVWPWALYLPSLS